MEFWTEDILNFHQKNLNRLKIRWDDFYHYWKIVNLNCIFSVRYFSEIYVCHADKYRAHSYLIKILLFLRKKKSKNSGNSTKVMHSTKIYGLPSAINSPPPTPSPLHNSPFECRKIIFSAPSEIFIALTKAFSYVKSYTCRGSVDMILWTQNNLVIFFSSSIWQKLFFILKMYVIGSLNLSIINFYSTI